MGNKLTVEEVQNRLQQYCKDEIKLIGEYVNRRTPILVQCQACKFEWEADPQLFLSPPKKESDGLHRCPHCKSVEQSEKQSTGQWVECAYCGKSIYRKQSEILKNKTGYFYCCKEHGNIHKNILRYQESGSSTNYRLTAMRTYPHKCMVCGWNEDERLLEVHHIDENHDNNVVDNLAILCPTCHRKITLHYYIYDKEKHTLTKIKI